MRGLNRGSSISDRLNEEVLPYNDWLRSMQCSSKKYLKVGSFLPAQDKLLRQVYDGLKSNQKVISFTAPPASGKTHVIVLVAYHLFKKGIQTCIVTPNNELRTEFQKELLEINNDAKVTIPIESINTYRKRRNQFDFVLMDEAHNLRSAIELDPSLVKSFHFEEGDSLFEYLTLGMDAQKKYVTKELNIETASDILKEMEKTAFCKDAQYLQKKLSQWRAFLVVFKKVCTLKFLLADPRKRSILPHGRLFLFSATRLDEEELAFYCDIKPEILQIIGEKETAFIPKANVQYRFLNCDTDLHKLENVCTLLNAFSLPTLIILNNNVNCLTWANELAKKFSDRVVCIESGQMYSKRTKVFEEFTKGTNKILVTASAVYWEGLTIKNLNLLVIPNNPFPQPTILEMAQGKHPEYQKIANRRLIQGIGRIGRIPSEKGICLLLFKPSSVFRFFRATSLDEVISLMKGWL